SDPGSLVPTSRATERLSSSPRRSSRRHATASVGSLAAVWRRKSSRRAGLRRRASPASARLGLRGRQPSSHAAPQLSPLLSSSSEAPLSWGALFSSALLVSSSAFGPSGYVPFGSAKRG